MPEQRMLVEDLRRLGSELEGVRFATAPDLVAKVKRRAV